MKLREIFAEAVSKLRENEIMNPERDARALVSFGVGIPADRLTISSEYLAGKEQIQKVNHLLQRRIDGWPVSRILGKRLFWGREFLINDDVLDPRGDTETLIALALQKPGKYVLDLGTGSGAIGLTLASEWPDAQLVASDLSKTALDVARQNAIKLGVIQRCQFVNSDWFHSLEGQFDLIVSNPPYISEGEMALLSREVKNHDPSLALFAGPDGLSAYRTISEQAKNYLIAGGRLLFEIGHRQASAVSQILQEQGYIDIAVHQDLDRKDRVVSCRSST
ncbi:MAG: peptide chain release factor N(5)-glutamine methyltransferase [Paracoccaceae bacterium]